MNSHDTFGTLDSLSVGDEKVSFYSLEALERAGFPKVARLPYSLKVLLENLLRREDGRSVTADDIKALADWDPSNAVSYTHLTLPTKA